VTNLSQLGDKSVVPNLLPLLKDFDFEVRSSATLALGDLGSQFAVPYLLPLLKDDSHKVRQRAAEALKRLGYTSP
jgi:HEAT repeat protein